MSTEAAQEIFKAHKNDEPEDVLFNSLYGLRTIELNRPKKLNALNGSMVRKIAPRLLEWSKSDMANIIVLKGAGDKAFCAGGDVAEIAGWNKQGEAGVKRSIHYFGLEYKLDHLIATYSKPLVAFMDGITMGGGVGLSVHAPIRIATERTVFAMPETTIGFFPDVGASFFLPRMDGEIGTYLALTSERLKGPDVLFAGIATHYIHSTSLSALESRLAELRFRDYDTLEERLALISATIEEFSTGIPHDHQMLLSGSKREAIDRCFRFNDMSEIVYALQNTPTNQKWAKQTLETLQQRSPTALHVALRQMRIGRGWSIAETFRREYQIAAKFMRGHEFNEGVTARLIEKRDPKWEPASLEDIEPEDNIAEPFFLPDPKLPALELLNDADYQEPAYQLGLPRENDVKKLVLQGLYDRHEIVEKLLSETRHKQGVKEAVWEIVTRKTKDGKPATWIE